MNLNNSKYVKALNVDFIPRHLLFLTHRGSSSTRVPPDLNQKITERCLNHCYRQLQSYEGDIVQYTVIIYRWKGIFPKRIRNFRPCSRY